MAIVADANGVIKGKFTIPAGVRAGSKSVELVGSGGSRGSAVFVGQGTLVSNVLQSQTQTTQTFHDPLAQTFALNEENQIGGVEIFVTAKGDTPITVQLRETQLGFPNQNILVQKSLNPANVVVGQWNRFEFDKPVHALPNVEYAIVVLCNDAVGAIAVAELGKWDSVNQRWVTQQPYQVGVLLSSSNASTWTAHQDRDMTFRLLARRYAEAAKEVDLGTIAVNGATDLIVLSMADNPATGADSELQLTMPDTSIISSSDGQGVRFAAPVTGNIKVKAKLRATQKASAVLHPGSQLVVGAVATTASYVTRAMDAEAAGANIRVIFDANLPSGSSVKVFVKGDQAADPWLPVTQQGVAKPVGDNIYEYQYLYTNLQKAKVQIKLELTGTVAARPFVYNLRVSTVTTAQ